MAQCGAFQPPRAHGGRGHRRDDRLFALSQRRLQRLIQTSQGRFPFLGCRPRRSPLRGFGLRDGGGPLLLGNLVVSLALVGPARPAAAGKPSARRSDPASLPKLGPQRLRPGAAPPSSSRSGRATITPWCLVFGISPCARSGQARAKWTRHQARCSSARAVKQPLQLPADNSAGDQPRRLA